MLENEIVQKGAGPNVAKAAREWERVVFVCLFVFVHVCNTSVGMFILKLQYVEVFTYRMLTITYYILSYVNGTWKPFVQHLVFLNRDLFQ